MGQSFREKYKGVWHKLCPQLKEDFEDFEEPVDIVRNETEKIVEIANKLQLCFN